MPIIARNAPLATWPSLKKSNAVNGFLFSGHFFLLDKPESLPEFDGRPHRRGPLKLLAGPERIDSGWWDGGEATGDVRRDYFVACSADTRWLWIYRECLAPGGWFLQGFFS